MKVFTHWQDIAALLTIGIYGFFLIGNITQGNFLDTGYQDWLYHALRLELVQDRGITSWEHFWSNGLNLWRSYQYVIYYLLLGVNSVLNLPIPQLMLWSVVFVFIASRLVWYLVLRSVKVRPSLAFLAVLSSFYMVQQWSSIKDFSIYIASFYLPFFIFVWIKSTQRKNWTMVVSPLAGFAWFLHPVLGLICSGLWGLSFLFLVKKMKLYQIMSQWISFLLIVAGFFVPYFAYGYGFSHPVFSSVEFLVTSLQRAGFLGLSQLLLLMLVFSWVILVIKLSKLKRWYKILTLFSSLFLLAVILGMRNFLPGFIMQLQFSRGVFLIGYLICFGFGYALEQIVTKKPKKMLMAIIAFASAIIMTESIIWSADLSAPVVKSLDNPVTEFLSKNQPVGNVYFRVPALSSYMDFDKVRFVNSYNWHMEPSPYSYRYTQLLNTDFAFNSVAPSKLETLEAYTHVLNVEYLTLPVNSPLMRSLTEDEKATQFTPVLTTTHNDVSYSFIKSSYPIAFAYYIPDAVIDEVISTDTLESPTLKVSSFKPWDDAIKKLHLGLQKPEVIPLAVRFPEPEVIEVDLPSLSDEGQVLILQSHDPYWQSNKNISLSPTNTRFMLADVSVLDQSSTLSLRHSWPTWFWPLQVVSFVTTGVTVIIMFIFIFKNRHATEK